MEVSEMRRKKVGAMVYEDYGLFIEFNGGIEWC